MVAADFNGDGKPDLAATKFNTDNVAVLLNSTVTNQAPVAADDTYSTAEDTALTVNAWGAGQRQRPGRQPAERRAGLRAEPRHPDPERQRLVHLHPGQPTSTAATPSPTRPATAPTSNPATVTISVTAVNDAPTAADDAYSTAEDTALTVATPGVWATTATRTAIR